MQTHRVNKHGFVPDITPEHPLGDPNRSTASRKKPSAAAGSANTDTSRTTTDDFDGNIIGTLVIK